MMLMAEAELYECGSDCKEALTWPLMQPDCQLSLKFSVSVCECVCVTSTESGITMKQEITALTKNSLSPPHTKTLTNNPLISARARVPFKASSN